MDTSVNTGKSRTEMHSAERIEQIKAAAAEIFARRGYKGASMREIANACNISKALLYHHFESKDQIYSIVASEVSAHLYTHVEECVRREEKASDKLRAFMTATADHFHRNRWAWMASTTAFWNDPELRQQEERLTRRDRYERQLRGIIQEAIDAGEIRSDVDVAMAGRLVLSALNWMPRWYNPKKSMTPHEIAGQYFEMIFEGLRPRD
ncbi:TetR/AcrR family transcriptional regulator [Aquamicrobium sp. LC103]|uniref:TetR/AcrR family transcriptional regulator n=1 Tax=Aquamicrobium sp. LC103 TaxID=1120658 RepID=UPI001FEDB8DF|nr:TetR/AcrR family transcriptional regulator [Aquamicrobium sp. LC103]